ncbi:protein-export chaperone SecB [Gynuella sunshinyii]|uniref:Protein-export protein SecB n=1 Tax=Gynuella sunshinyii YC6258 TaxID=1445510 RepID=A0A0C5VH95_9GAMM|nr:protein-export chaperone SecB [Gynuella sunshinyii]AJQ94027.1 preprotein translocase subunit SecB [Gynuella sunshinyii YC6258]
MTEQKKPVFGIQRLYIKDSSFESPNSPQIFRHPWEPKINLDMNTKTKQLDAAVYEVVLMLTVTTKVNDEVAFVAEVQQCGIFNMENFEEEVKNQMLGAYCPNLLFPYARAYIDNLVVQGSFPPVHLAPINFDAIYQQKLAELNANSDSSSETESSMH